MTSNNAPTVSVRRRIEATLLALAASQGEGDGSTYATCVGCGHAAIVGAAPRNPRGFQRAHIVSEFNGGKYTMANMTILCRRCNSKMGDRNMSECLTPRYDIHAGWNGKMLPDPGPYDSLVDNDEWLPA